jgi:hypothetical protein
MELKINLSVEGIATSDLTTNEIISNDDIKKISFAAGGDSSEYDFLTYVAKDKRDNRCVLHRDRATWSHARPHVIDRRRLLLGLVSNCVC